MNKKFIYIIFLFFIVIKSFGQKTEKFIDSIRVLHKIPEINYAVINENQILEIASLGKHSVNLPDSATLNDRFHLGSNTKAMTAFLIAKYVEKGYLRWNTKFFDLFPNWKKWSRKEYYNITLEELLSHRAKIQPFQGFEDPKIPNFKGNSQQKRQKFGQFVLTLEPVKMSDKETFVYSNAGYTLASLMVEKVTGKSWEKLVDQTFNKDLKLNVGVHLPDNQNYKETWGHSDENGTLIPISSKGLNYLEFTEPAGDINMKLTDYIKFIQLNLNGLLGKDNYLKASTYQYLHHHFEGYSLGWYNITEKNKVWSNHSGTASTYYTNVHINKTDSICYIVFANSFNENTTNGVRLIMRKLKENYGK